MFGGQTNYSFTSSVWTTQQLLGRRNGGERYVDDLHAALALPTIAWFIRSSSNIRPTGSRSSRFILSL